MSIVPLQGHAALRARLLGAHARGALPASLLFHGLPGVGKQRLALWLGQALLCEAAMAARPNGEPCGTCRSCRYAEAFAHPDLAWYFPRPRAEVSDDDPDEVRAAYREVAAERAKANGLYAAAEGTDGLFVSTVRAIVRQAAMAPAVGRRKVFVVGDADRMAPLETSTAEAANAFLKLLEEPPADTTIVLTSSEPGALLPTIRSRVVAVRAAPLADDEVRAWLADARVRQALGADGLELTSEAGVGAAVALAAGAPGRLLARREVRAADAEAGRLLDAALSGDRAARMRAAMAQGVSKARGAFSDVLDALAVRLHALAREAASGPRPDAARALGACRGVEAVEAAKQQAAGNVNPQLVAAGLLRALAEGFGRAV